MRVRDVSRLYLRRVRITPLNALDGEERARLVEFLEGRGLASIGVHVTRNDPFGILLTALDDGQVLGMVEGPVDVRWWNDDEEPGHRAQFAYCYQVIVHPDRHREGIGRALVLAFANEAQAAGCTWIQLLEHPNPDVGERVAFFVSLGFRRLDLREDGRLWGAAIADLR